MVEELKGWAGDIGFKIAGALSRLDPTEDLLLFCDPRGGSTWLAELIRHVPGTAAIWEPLTLDRAPGPFQQLGFSWRQYIPEDAEWPEAREAFERLLSGRLINGFTGKMTTRREILTAQRLMIKFCRANLMLPWITRNFSLRYAPIHLIRHPYAVVASQQRHVAWKNKPRILADPAAQRFAGPLTRHRDFFNSLETWEQQWCAIWFIHNEAALTHPRRGKDWMTIRYEDLLFDAPTTIQGIFENWGLPVPEDLLEAVPEPSRTTRDATFLVSKQKQLNKWRDQFSEEQIAQMEEVWRYFTINAGVELRYEV